MTLRKKTKYWNLKEEALDHPLWGIHCGPVAR